MRCSGKAWIPPWGFSEISFKIPVNRLEINDSHWSQLMLIFAAIINKILSNLIILRDNLMKLFIVLPHAVKTVTNVDRDVKGCLHCIAATFRFFASDYSLVEKNDYSDEELIDLYQKHDSSIVHTYADEATAIAAARTSHGFRESVKFNNTNEYREISSIAAILITVHAQYNPSTFRFDVSCTDEINMRVISGIDCDEMRSIVLTPRTLPRHLYQISASDFYGDDRHYRRTRTHHIIPTSSRDERMKIDNFLSCIDIKNEYPNSNPLEIRRAVTRAAGFSDGYDDDMPTEIQSGFWS